MTERREPREHLGPPREPQPQPLPHQPHHGHQPLPLDKRSSIWATQRWRRSNVIGLARGRIAQARGCSGVQPEVAMIGLRAHVHATADLKKPAVPAGLATTSFLAPGAGPVSPPVAGMCQRGLATGSETCGQIRPYPHPIRRYLATRRGRSRFENPCNYRLRNSTAITTYKQEVTGSSPVPPIEKALEIAGSGDPLDPSQDT